MGILLFHRVTDAIPEDGLTVGVDRFRRICAMLAKRFHVVPLQTIVDIHRSKEKIPPRTVAITFDDSYQCNLPSAQVLNEFGLPACFFIPTDFVQSKLVYPWDRKLPAQLPNLTWRDVEEIARMGFEIGSHTKSHPNMARLDYRRSVEEIRSSKNILEDRLGQKVRWFAYPFGGRDQFRPDQWPIVTESGYEACFSGFGGLISRTTTDIILPRESVPYFHSIGNLELHLKGCLHWFYNLKGLPQYKGELDCGDSPELSSANMIRVQGTNFVK